MRIPLRRPDTPALIAAYSPSGKVPALIDGAETIWDSLAILDYIDRCFPEATMWPDDLAAFGRAKSIAAEMHSGFAAVRRELSMDIGADLPTPDLSDEARGEIARILSIWRDARSRFGGAGPFLFGRFTNADAMYAPVVTRFKTYGVPVDPVCLAYMHAVLALPAMEEWYGAAASEAAGSGEP